MITVDFLNCFILIFLCFFSLLCYYLFFKKPKHGFNLPPSPPSLPIIGHLHLLLSVLPHKAFQKISSRYGPLLHLRIFNVPLCLVSSASVAYEIFRTHDVNVSSRGVRTLENSLFFGHETFAGAPFGDYFKFAKKLLVMNLLGTQALERSRGICADEIERFYARLMDKARKKESVEIGKEAMVLTNNIISKLLIGRSCSEENGEAEKVRESVIKTMSVLKKVFFSNMFGKTLKKVGVSLFEKEIRRACSRFDELLERHLKEHEEKPEKHSVTDMMDVLLAASRDENADYKITKTHIKLLMVELFLGGTDSPAKLIQWAMAEIINKPNTLERLRQEMDSVVGKTRLIQETDLPRLPYLQAVVKETLRLHPPAPLLIRMFEEECKVGGFSIPEKTTLVVNAYVVMRDPNLWQDPDEFKPERFLAEQEEEREKVLKFLPFGSGRRGCPGANLGYIFVEIGVGMMVQCFDWIIKGDETVKMEETVAGLSLTMAHPIICTLLPRTEF
ncbi:unnamed protein product [Eruca vesicaria subsp. sativa]|uniref:Cytochrome P450 n=1 Tax=Eruca vesicaria subsp. sativa TaxID=29727 RepID=A0ABC8IQT0_ERUVS|nr:unnamed protein product [Eruca vesicaria subsp. sativa]